MSELENKIEAHDRSISEVLKDKKYTVDYFQREYNWGEQHIAQLVSDLTSAFLNEYSEGDERKKTAGYNSYYLGPFVVSENNNGRSIIDGQQRLTSITLFLIYLNHLQKEQGLNNKIEDMIFSEAYGELSFNINVEERIDCLKALFESGNYILKDEDNESTINMVNRYNDIATAFPEDEIKGPVLSMFIDWLTRKVVLIEIIAYKDENAYTIFETMNDRGLNLTPTEMLKSFLLSKYNNKDKREKINKFWKVSMQKLHDFNKDEDQRFIQSWLRAKYADTIRESKKDATNEDFEKIGTRFHSWVRDKSEMLKLNTDGDFERFVEAEFKFYLDAYLTLLDATQKLSKETENIYYLDDWGIATSLSYPLMLAPLTLVDDKNTIKHKMNLVAKYLEIFVVRRSVNNRRFAASSIRYTMYTLVKEIRNKTVDELRAILNKKIEAIPEKWDAMAGFTMNGQNKKFVKFLLSRISGYIDTQAGQSTNYDSYFRPTGKQFEIEHIWADKYERHIDEFPQKADFINFRNRLGDLVLLPRGTNQSYGDKEYAEKHKHYVKENLLVQSLTPLAYENNPNFTNLINTTGLSFKPHGSFKKEDIEARQALYQAICEQIWKTL